MKNFLRLFLCLCLTSWATAAEIFAWKVPLSHFTPAGLDAPGVARLEAAPEKSPFFAEGDELWGIGAARPELIAKPGGSLEWVIWNATSDRLVAKGSQMAIYSLHHHLGIGNLPVHCRHRIDVFRIGKDVSPPDFSIKPDASLSFVARSGLESSASSSGEGNKVRFYGTSVFGEDYFSTELAMRLTVSFPDSPELEIESSVVLRNESGMWIAREHDGDSGIDIRITPTFELGDGTPYSEVTLRQDGGLAEPFSVDRRAFKLIPIGEGRWLAYSWFPPSDIGQMFANYPDREDPFAADSPHGLEMVMKALTKAQAPENLVPHFTGSVIDLTKGLVKSGLIFKEGDFAGYDPASQLIFMSSSTRNELDKFEQLFTPLHCGYGTNLAITAKGLGEVRLLSRSGMTASLKSTRGEPEHTRHLEILPTLGITGEDVDLRVVYQEESEKETVRSLETSTTLIAGKFIELFKEKHSDDSGASMKLKADVIRLH